MSCTSAAVGSATEIEQLLFVVPDGKDLYARNLDGPSSLYVTICLTCCLRSIIIIYVGLFKFSLYTFPGISGSLLLFIRSVFSQIARTSFSSESTI